MPVFLRGLAKCPEQMTTAWWTEDQGSVHVCVIHSHPMELIVKGRSPYVYVLSRGERGKSRRK